MNFFRTYQRPILFTAVLFALVTFSITGDMLSFFGGLFQKERPAATIQVDGREIKLASEDYAVARKVANFLSRPIAAILPTLKEGGDEKGMIDELAALRRAAVERGIGASFDEVDRAIEKYAALMGDVNIRDYARFQGFASPQDLRATVYEAMRIATMLRLESFPIVPTDAEVAERWVKNREFITVKVASLDRKDIEKTIEAELDAEADPKAVLIAWADELDTNQRKLYSDPSLYRCDFFAIEVDKFDANEWEAELADLTIGEPELQSFYERQKEAYFRRESSKDDDEGDKGEGNGEGEGNEDEEGGKGGDGGAATSAQESEGAQDPGAAASDAAAGDDRPTGDEASGDEAQDASDDPPQDPYKPFDEVKDHIRKRLQAEHVLRKIWNGIQPDLFAAIEPLTRARNDALTVQGEATTALTEAQKAAAADPKDEALEAAVEAAEAALETADEALEAAEEALVAGRAAFDFKSAFEAATAGKAGFSVVDSGEELKVANDLAEIEGLGTWAGSSLLASLREKGATSSRANGTSTHVFYFRITDLTLDPLKDWEEIEDELREAYLKEKAQEIGKERKEAFEEQLEAAARAQVAAKIEELEQAKATKLEERMTEWKDDLQAEVARIQALHDAENGSRAKRNYAQQLAKLRKDLEGEADHREAVEKELSVETDAEIKEAMMGSYAAVIDQVAEAAGFKIEIVGPDLSNKARRGIISNVPEVEQFAFYGGRLSHLKEGEATDVMDDSMARAYRLAVVQKVEPATVSAMTRRDLLEAKNPVQLSSRAVRGLQQSVTEKALQARLKYAPAGEEEIDANVQGS